MTSKEVFVDRREIDKPGETPAETPKETPADPVRSPSIPIRWIGVPKTEPVRRIDREKEKQPDAPLELPVPA